MADDAARDDVHHTAADEPEEKLLMSVEIITTVTAPAVAVPPGQPYDLTTLDVLKNELNITKSDQDQFLSRVLAQTSATINAFCNRVFQVEGLTDEFYIQQDPYPNQNPAGILQLQLSRWPLIPSIPTVTQQTGKTTTQTLTLGSDYKIDATKGWLIRLNNFTGFATCWEAIPTSVSYRAGFTQQIVNEAKTIPASGAYQVTVANASAFALDNGVLFADTLLPLVAVASNPGEGQYAVANSIYVFNVADAGRGVLISYLFAQIPFDIVDACLRLSTARFTARGRDPNLMERDQPAGGIGREKWWVGGAPGQISSLPPEIENICEQYRVPVVG